MYHEALWHARGWNGPMYGENESYLSRLYISDMARGVVCLLVVEHSTESAIHGDRQDWDCWEAVKRNYRIIVVEKESFRQQEMFEMSVTV